jgi:hypothetical protein
MSSEQKLGHGNVNQTYRNNAAVLPLWVGNVRFSGRILQSGKKNRPVKDGRQGGTGITSRIMIRF